MIKRNNLVLILVFLLIVFLNFPLLAATTTTRTVTITVSSINSLGVTGPPGTLAITSAVAGSQPTDATDASTSYRVSTNNTNRRITGQITTGGDMPTGLTLKISLDATGIGTSVGQQTLISTAAVNLVTAITQIYGIKVITYTLSATVAAGEVSGSRTITLTVSA